jgi:hypothetical protein
LLLAGRRRDHGKGVGYAPIFAEFGNIVEEGEEAVVIALGDGIELVVVAMSAAKREAEPRDADRIDAIGDVLDAIFLFDDAAFGIDDVIAKETGGNALVERGIGEQVPGDLLGDELVVGEIAVEALDHPVAPAPHRAGRIVIESMSVGVAGHVEPIEGHALAVAW